MMKIKHLADLFKLDLADELLGRDELTLDELVFRLKVDDPPEIGNGELGLEDLEITCRATFCQHAMNDSLRHGEKRTSTDR